ncbi:hypothetical protein KQ41_23440 [Lysinibacillus fusiformis]|nr:hypothetical protein HR49_03655 [Lysinibacillus fusiformis]KGA80254.1 hypothetical protein KQ41_23440 [Lysinibacillus fusiformis]KHK50274.1 hypothetical protein PI85_17905 [Lysinibacillus sp. A1]
MSALPFFLYNDEKRKRGPDYVGKEMPKMWQRKSLWSRQRGKRMLVYDTELSRAIVKYDHDEYMYLSSVLRYI